VIYENAVRNLVASADSVTSTHIVRAEWNMNRYQKIDNLGIYAGAAGECGTSYSDADEKIMEGTTYNFYDDDLKEAAQDAENFSNIASVFKPDRPDPGIVLLQQYRNVLISKDAFGDTDENKISTSAPRFYPHTRNRDYDYFNFAKRIDSRGADSISKTGLSTANGGAVKNTNPFVVYENEFPCNKIVIKVQNHASVPDIYAIDILENDEWIQVFSANTSSGFTDGILEIYYNGTSTWTQTATYVTDLSEIGNPSTQLKMIQGIRFRVFSLTVFTTGGKNYESALELIEISPRIHADISNYTETFSFNSSLGDSEFGLPVGSIVASDGNVTISNENKDFMLSGSAAFYKMLTPDVEFKFYQVVSETYTIPLKTMYAEEWSLKQDFSVEVKLSDRLRFFQEKNVSDMLIYSTGDGVPFSSLILMILDNAGITGYNFKQSQEQVSFSESVKIKSFFCKKEQTVAEVLEKLAIATQSAMFFDADGDLNVITKEKITKPAKLIESTSTNNGTDFWIVFDEEYDSSDAEYAYLNNKYLSNVLSSQEDKIDPVTDGTIKYHQYGVRQTAGQALVDAQIPKELTEEIPPTVLALSGFAPSFDILWSLGSGNDSVLAAATLSGNISANTVESQFTSPITASNQYHAISQMVANATTSQKAALLIPIETSEALLFTRYKGYVMIDREYIAYNGIVYSINGQNNVVIFNKEQLQEKINSLTKRSSSILPKALVVETRFNVTATTSGDLYEYVPISSGRGQFNTDIEIHRQDPIDYLGEKLTFILGAIPGQARANWRTGFTTTTKYDYADVKGFKALKTRLGIPATDFSSATGFIKISGPRSPMEDIRAANSASSVQEQNKINNRVDAEVGPSMAPYVYTQGERDIYLQKIDIGTVRPDLIATRMKLYSGRQNIVNGRQQYSTNSSIAGIAFCVKKGGGGNILSGYFLEVESKSSAAKDFAGSKTTIRNNLRFYKVETIGGKLTATVLALASAPVATSVNEDTRFVTSNSLDLETVFNLEIRTNVSNNKTAVFSIYYNGNLITTTKPIQDTQTNFWTNSKNVYAFVRNDSDAIYEYVIAAQRPENVSDKNKYFSNFFNARRSLAVEGLDNFMQGNLDETYYNFFKNKVKFVYRDFARTVREVAKYTPRYERPALTYKLIDVSAVNPQYMIKEANFSGFGAEIVVVNSTRHPIWIKEDSPLPLYIYGVQIQEISDGEIRLRDLYENVSSDNKKLTDSSFNKSVYGDKVFNLDSEYIQNIPQVTDLLKWISNNCTRQRIRMTLEIYANPLLEVGDKVRVYSKDRGYRQSNQQFGDKTFIITDITHEVSIGVKKMSITIVEVGEV
jgi:hypothetical protein